MRPPVAWSSTGDEMSGVRRATPASRWAAASTSADVGSAADGSGAAMAQPTAAGPRDARIESLKDEARQSPKREIRQPLAGSAQQYANHSAANDDPPAFGPFGGEIVGGIVAPPREPVAQYQSDHPAKHKAERHVRGVGHRSSAT